MGGTLEVASYGALQTLMVVGDHQLDPAQASSLQGSEKLVVGRFALGVRYLHRQDLPETVVSDPRDHQDPLAHHPRVHPHLLVAGIHEQVGVSLRFELARPPRLEFGVKGAGQL